MNRRDHVWLSSLGISVLLGVGVGVALGADLVVVDNGTSVRFRLQSDGTTEVTADGTTPAFTVSQANTGKLLALVDGATEVFTVADGGRVGVNRPTPAAALDVAGNVAVTGTVDGVDVSAHAIGNPNAHHTPPTSLPPGGPAGGDLANTYPNPTVANVGAGASQTLQAGSAPTDEGRVQWDTANDRIVVGTSGGTATFHSGLHTTDTFVTNKDAHDHADGDGAQIQHANLGGVSGSGHPPNQAAANVVYGGGSSNADAWHTHAGLGSGSGPYQFKRLVHNTTSSSFTPALNAAGPGVLYLLRKSNNGTCHYRVTIDGVQLFGSTGTPNGTFHISQLGTNFAGEPHRPWNVEFKTSLLIEVASSNGGPVTTTMHYGQE